MALYEAEEPELEPNCPAWPVHLELLAEEVTSYDTYDIKFLHSNVHFMLATEYRLTTGGSSSLLINCPL